MIKSWPLALGLFLSQASFAQDYYTPVKKELESLARLPIESFELNDGVLRYRLPQDLTGRPLDIELFREGDAGPALRLYKGPLATASCMGTDELPACVVTHRNLNIDPKVGDEFQNRKYKDPELRLRIKEVRTTFDTPNEPIGFISRRSLLDVKPLSQNWQTSYKRMDGKTQEQVRITLNGSSGTYSFVDQGATVQGQLSEIFVHGFHMSGRWTLNGTSGWFHFILNTSKDTFEGTWGTTNAQGVNERKGTWNGRAS